MRGKLPESVLTGRRPASTFRRTIGSAAPLRALLLDTLTPDAIDATGIFDSRAIHALIRDHMERRINVGYHLWGLLTLFLWMKRWKVETLPSEEAARSSARSLSGNRRAGRGR